jgi:hypothetical protein
MNNSRILFGSLLALAWLSACAPSPALEPAILPVAEPVEPSASPGPARTNTAAATAAVQTETAPPPAAATSRGPALEATDPTTVRLAAGELQLVEFFRFT